MLGQDEKPTETYQDIGWYGHPEAGDSRGGRASIGAVRLVPSDRYRPTAWCIALRSSGTGKTMWSRPSPTPPPPASSAWLVPNSCQKYLGEGPRRFATYSDLLARTHQPSSSLTKSTLLPPSDSMQNRCRSRSTTYLAGVAQPDGRFRSRQQRQGHHGHQPSRQRSTQRFSDQAVWIERSNSLHHQDVRSVSSSRPSAAR